ncbi:hypothetical protein ANANG_G00014290 [Anguilla anguilla]|uniref:Uncharacterized protein n=1 Tax=Anguilla anguilla TaxID=7936 RepID=A0A9D3MY40_ANGAN|nr:hypothetical protein ANANG_G00014290 [Anguilla anguilla]
MPTVSMHSRAAPGISFFFFFFGMHVNLGEFNEWIKCHVYITVTFHAFTLHNLYYCTSNHTLRRKVVFTLATEINSITCDQYDVSSSGAGC